MKSSSTPAGADQRTIDNVLGQQVMGDFKPSDLWSTAATLAGRAVRRPRAALETSARLAGELVPIALGRSRRQPPAGDRRFGDPAWSDNPVSARVLQSYLALTEALDEYAERAGGSGRQAERSRFLLTQIANALAPTNFLATNPAALRTAVETRGASLRDGARNFVDDVRHRRPIPSQVDESGYVVGENLASTPGSVIARTELFELIQYAPQTPKVRSVPIVIVPSIVNKFYVLDLAPERSVIEHLVRNRLTVFVVAWRNPQQRHDRWGMAEYQDSIDSAIDTAMAVTSAQRVNLWAVCGAGPVAVSLAAHHAAVGAVKINSLLLVVSPLDTQAMSAAPSIGAFIDSKDRPAPRSVTTAASGRRMSSRDFTLLFAMLRSNELIWNYWVNNYLLGRKPPAFDVLYWNADGTGMTAGFNRDFSEFVERNPFVDDGAMTVRGEAIAPVNELGFDSYVLGARNDHLCVWQAVYRSAQLLGADTTFVLGNSGHIQTIVCPPDNPKASFATGRAAADSPEAWLETAEQHAGSWWDHYVAWVAKRSGRLVAAPTRPGDDEHPVLAPAPGTYVHERH